MKRAKVDGFLEPLLHELVATSPMGVFAATAVLLSFSRVVGQKVGESWRRAFIRLAGGSEEFETVGWGEAAGQITSMDPCFIGHAIQINGLQLNTRGKLEMAPGFSVAWAWTHREVARVVSLPFPAAVASPDWARVHLAGTVHATVLGKGFTTVRLVSPEFSFVDLRVATEALPSTLEDLVPGTKVTVWCAQVSRKFCNFTVDLESTWSSVRPPAAPYLPPRVPQRQPWP